MPRLFHVSDLHFGRADLKALDWFAAAVHRERPDAVVLTGDLTMRARRSQFAAACSWLAGLDVPLSIEPGNHDLPYYNPLKRLISPYKRFRRIERALEAPLHVPGLWLVPLRTTSRAQWRLNWAAGRVSRESLDKALDRLAARPDGDMAVIACHHPLVASHDRKSHGRTVGGERALAALAAAGASAVLSGHTHDPFDMRREVDGLSIRMIGAGTLSERVRHTPPSFNELTVAEGKLDVRMRELAL